MPVNSQEWQQIALISKYAHDADLYLYNATFTNNSDSEIVINRLSLGPISLSSDEFKKMTQLYPNRILAVAAVYGLVGLSSLSYGIHRYNYLNRTKKESIKGISGIFYFASTWPFFFLGSLGLTVGSIVGFLGYPNHVFLKKKIDAIVTDLLPEQFVVDPHDSVSYLICFKDLQPKQITID